jgi:hypothetical protein
MLAAAAITLTTLAAKAPEAVFLKARNLVAEATDPVEGLSAAIAAIKGAQESCSADKEADAPLRRVLDQTLAGYERRHSLATVKPQVRRMPARHARHCCLAAAAAAAAAPPAALQEEPLARQRLHRHSTPHSRHCRRGRSRCRSCSRLRSRRRRR